MYLVFKGFKKGIDLEKRIKQQKLLTLIQILVKIKRNINYFF